MLSKWLYTAIVAAAIAWFFF